MKDQFKRNIIEIKALIDSLASKSEKELREGVINSILDKKLDRNYNNYVAKVTNKINYILSRNNYKVIKAINQIAKDAKKMEDEDYE